MSPFPFLELFIVHSLSRARHLVEKCLDLSDSIQILRIDHSLVLAESFINRVHGSCSRHHGQIDPPAQCVDASFATVMKLPGNDVPAHEQAHCFTRACAAVGSTGLLA